MFSMILKIEYSSVIDKEYLNTLLHLARNFRFFWGERKKHNKLCLMF